MNSIINKIPKLARTIGVLAFWVLVWSAIAIKVDKQILVASPSDVAKRFCELLRQKEFYSAATHSILRIAAGFFAAAISGAILGVATAKIRAVDELVSPLMSLVKATPVASFIILALVWIDKQSIPSFISFLMATPIVHGNVAAGVKNTPPDLSEMAKLYRLSPWIKLKKLYFPAIFPYFTAGFKTALGLTWKAGVAAEVLCTPKNSIGKELYQAKIYLETVDVFTWTATIIIISVIIEKILMWSVERLTKKAIRRKKLDLS